MDERVERDGTGREPPRELVGKGKEPFFAQKLGAKTWAKKFFDRLGAVCKNFRMATMKPAGQTLLTLETDHSKQTFAVLGGHNYQYLYGSGNQLRMEFPVVQHILTEPKEQQENIITDEEKQQRNLIEHVEKIVRTFRVAERGLLEDADLKRKQEREREGRNEKRRSKIKQAINDAFDAGLYDDEIIEALPDGLRGHFETLQEQLELDVDLDNLLAGV